ncbi:MAG: hypothetical protein KDC69_11715 [Flavobacteriaceae bacterium]|nr:hypothetical protein [Flavobacteriaceae bacterium]
MREVMLIIHFIGLGMGIGVSFAHAFLGIATSKMTDGEAIKFRLHTLVLSKMGNIGIALLIISGLYLITPYWKILPTTPLLIVKLALVVILTVLITMLNMIGKKAMTGDAEGQLKKMEPIGKSTLLIGLAIIVLAVYIFH